MIIPGARHIVTLEASHGWIMEDPVPFAAEVDRFIREVTRQRSVPGRLLSGLAEGDSDRTRAS